MTHTVYCAITIKINLRKVVIFVVQSLKTPYKIQLRQPYPGLIIFDSVGVREVIKFCHGIEEINNDYYMAPKLIFVMYIIFMVFSDYPGTEKIRLAKHSWCIMKSIVNP